MKYTVMVVDDEPAAVEHICAIIEKKCPTYEVIATANNGMNCLELIHKTKPDIVITDVKMPIMNGIELIKQLHEEYPSILTLIVSGYQEFEYAKGALKYQAVDYIQKPVLPSDLQETLKAMSERLDERYLEERNKIIRGLTRGVQVERDVLKRYFPAERYYGLIIRKNGLPRRFKGTKDIEVFSEFHESIIIYGRDEMESLYLIPYHILVAQGKERLEDYAKKLISKDNNAFYVTVIISREPFEVYDLSPKVTCLYQVLNKYSVIGLNQILYLEDIKRNTMHYPDVSNELKKLDYYISTHQTEKEKQEFKKIFEIWEKGKVPQLQIEVKVWDIIKSFQKYGEDIESDMGFEYQMEDAFYYASSMNSLWNNIETMLFQDEKEEEIMKGKIDTPEYFGVIKNYIINNLAEPLSLQSVSKDFGISQTYLSKLFRKYVDKSFNNYLTDVRIEKAKQIIRADKNVFIKDVAIMVGYSDQFYFSRIFRSYAGICPSDYIESV